MKKLSAVFIRIFFFMYCINLIPAQGIKYSLESGKERLDYYLDAADKQTSQKIWEEYAEDGLIAAIAVWERENRSFASTWSCS